MRLRNQNRYPANLVLQLAESNVGYRARAQKSNVYGQELGQDGSPWAGAFLETVMRDAGELSLPSLVHTTSALAEFVRTNRIYKNPKPGDLAFFAYSTDGPFSQPHIGLVTDITRWKSDGEFRAISGQIASGLSKGPQNEDGVYERLHMNTEILAFARPRYGKNVRVKVDETAPALQPSQLQFGKSTKATVLLQTALAETVGARGMVRGKFDTPTKLAVASYQRKIGYGSDDAIGQINVTTLSRLALETSYRYFRVSDEVN